jgi:hypothetical protein
LEIIHVEATIPYTSPQRISMLHVQERKVTTEELRC